MDDLIQILNRSIDSESGATQDILVQMLRINAVNPRMGGPGEEERADFLEDLLRYEGFSIKRVDVKDAGTGKTRPNLSVKLEGKEPRNLWFVAHMDTVPVGSRELWKTDPFEPVVRDGKIIARGAEDNGQSLVSSLSALKELKRLDVRLPFNVGLWLVSDEEYGSEHGIKYLLSHGYFRRDDLVVVPDSGTPHGTDIEIAEKGLLWFKVTVLGKQVHASVPSKGANAHRVGINLTADLDKTLHNKYRREDTLFREIRSTFEPTMVEANVANVNTIPGVDIFYFDCRVLPAYDLSDVISDVKERIGVYEKKYRVRIHLDVTQSDSAGPATSYKSEVSTLLAKAVKRTFGRQPNFVGIGGLTVGNLFRKKGIPTAVWSTIDEVAHEPNEYCRIRNLVNDTKVFAALPLVVYANSSLSLKSKEDPCVRRSALQSHDCNPISRAAQGAQKCETTLPGCLTYSGSLTSSVVKPGSTWIGSIVIDCKKFDEMIAFWKAALGYQLRHPPSDDWALLYDPNGSGPNIAFQKDPNGPGEVYSFHFDLYSSDPKGEVKRLMRLGATMKQPARKGLDYVTLADPDGNPFDIVEARRFKFGQRVG